jgi:adenylate cyclase
VTTPASILIVDDTADNRELLCRRIEQQGHATTTAENGKLALELLAKQSFDLVLLDIMMPELTGFEVLERMKADERLKRIPVIVISALNDIESIVRCVQSGAEDYLFKPFNATLLKARVQACLEKKQWRDREHEMSQQLKREQERSEKLLLSIFPKSIAERLKIETTTIAEHFDHASILFADISGFSRLTEGLKPTAVVEMLNKVFSAFDRLAEKFGVEKIKTISDNYMAAAGVPTPRADHAQAMADLSLAMQQQAARLETGLDEPLSLRIGIDSGPVVAGVIGATRLAYDLWGTTVSRASQMESSGFPGTIQVTSATHDLLKDKYLFEERGSFYVPGQGEMTTYLLKGKKSAIK